MNSQGKSSTASFSGGTTNNDEGGLTTLLDSQRTTTINPDMKRSAVKDLIERYFYQLQRGCGNPKCSNINCASSGKVAPMTPNEIAAKALQLFSQDAKICECYNQPNKVQRTHNNDSPTSSSSTSAATTPSSRLDEEMLSPNENSNSSSSDNSTITSGSSNNSNSSSASGSSSSSDSSSDTRTRSTSMRSISANVYTQEGATPLLQAIFPISSPSNDNEVAFPGGSQTLETTATLDPLTYIDEAIIDEYIDEAINEDRVDRLIRAIDEIFSNVDKLSQSFSKPILKPLKSSATATKLQELLGKSPNDLKKEDIRTLEGENEKDEDSSCINDEDEYTEEAASSTHNIDDAMDEDSDTMHTQMGSSDTTVDLESLRRVKKRLFSIKAHVVGEILNSSILFLTDSLKSGITNDWEKVLHCLIICFDMATNASNGITDLEYIERSLPRICQVVRILPAWTQVRLARIWAAHCREQLFTFVQCCQQLITLQVIMDDGLVQENVEIIAITKVLKIVFCANILASQTEPYNYPNIDCDGDDTQDIRINGDVDDIFQYTQVPKPHYPRFVEDKLEKELNVSGVSCRVPLVPFEEFYNEPLSENIQMDQDYMSYKKLSLDPNSEDPSSRPYEDANFSFMLYSFILTPATKVIALYFDSRIRMHSERHSTLNAILGYFGDSSEAIVRPDLKLKVRRDHIIDDALIGLELVAMSNPKDLKKQLVVEFVGEQGIDEGGVSKEFFQMIVEEIFNPDFGMFTHQEETNTMWFNTAPFENDAQFTLIGIIIGLAIYNNIILAVNFPMVVYRKLMGTQGNFYDLKDWNPTLYRSLKSLLDYDGYDMEEVFMQTFKISYTNVFGEAVEHELKSDGGNIMVAQHNKQEFVDLYSDYLLNQSVKRQFKAFKRGFEMVTDESPLKLLFRPEEIELLVCGSRKFDFIELEKSTEYEGGYNKDTQIIQDFWSIVHLMPEDSKRKLLEFTTGSDRVPVGGLSRLKLLITRNGPDSERLPTSHTCFNVLLLPEYSTKDKLEERLLKAINNSKGFGML